MDIEYHMGRVINRALEERSWASPWQSEGGHRHVASTTWAHGGQWERHMVLTELGDENRQSRGRCDATSGSAYLLLFFPTVDGYYCLTAWTALPQNGGDMRPLLDINPDTLYHRE